MKGMTKVGWYCIPVMAIIFAYLFCNNFKEQERGEYDILMQDHIPIDWNTYPYTYASHWGFFVCLKGHSKLIYGEDVSPAIDLLFTRFYYV